MAIVGAGIVGLACAWEASRRGMSVVLIDRNIQQTGASVRNFGMVWPIGQPAGPRLDRALRSRARWVEASIRTGFWHEALGSMHVAYYEDEMAVLEEFVSMSGSSGHRARMLTPEQAIERSSWLVQEGLKGALLSETEVCVDARNAIASLTAYLCGPSEPGSVTLMRGHAVRAVEPPKVVLASGDTIQANRVCVCTGEDLRTLFPEAYHESGLRLCKLQMMRTVPQPGGVRMGPMLAAGSTLRHYPAFEHCPSLERVRARFSAERPHFDRFGLHVMASQTPAGEITLGDSHEYGEPISPFNRDDIDDWILEYLRTFLCLPDPRIAERWFGVYAKPKAGEHEFVASPYPSVRVISGVGGAGMTMSFGLVEDVFKAWCE